MKKIYFAAAIRGGRDDADLYREIIDYMKRDNIVLTEHIGLASLKDSGEDLNDIEIYERDINWLKESDVVIAECSTPSLGVGYELAYAERINKEVHVLYKKEKGISAMITGDKYFKLYPYASKDDLFSILDSILLS